MLWAVERLSDSLIAAISDEMVLNKFLIIIILYMPTPKCRAKVLNSYT